jgi:hypothetical protein
MVSKIEEALKGKQLSGEDPRARAAARAAEIDADYGDIDRNEEDLFWAPPAPDGWVYQWKRVELLGKSDAGYDVSVALGGWTSVPAERHPTMMPKNWQAGTIDRYGQRLMERPEVIEDRARARADYNARAQLQEKEAQLGGAPPGTMQRAKSDGSPLVNIKKTYERPMDVPQK